MDNYLIDRETLSQFIDGLIKKKPLPFSSTEELNGFREEQIKALDDRIASAVFGRLNESQLDEINGLLDNQETPAEVFREFFDKCGINLEKTITDEMQSFGIELLKGEQ